MSLLGKCKSKASKLPKGLLKIYAAVFVAYFSATFSVAMVFPFLPFMVEFLLPWLTEREELVATYAGIIAAVVAIGRIFGSYVWGAIADSKGRKPVLIASATLMGLTTAAFGFSVTFEMAIILRLLGGLSNGIIVTSKAVISEASDDSTQAFGVSLLGTAWGLAFILGPAVSGAISDPIGQYNLTIENDAIREFLTRFPYSLPCLLSSFTCALSVLFSLALLPETLAMKRNRKRSEIVSVPIHVQQNADVHVNEELSSDVTETNHASDQQLPSSREQSPLQSESELTDESHKENRLAEAESKLANHEGTQILLNNNDSEAKPGCLVTTRRRHSRGHVWKKVKISTRTSLKNLRSLLCDRSTGLSLLTYAVFSSVDIGFVDIYPVWAKTSPRLGGLGFSLSEIGITLTVSSVILIPFSLVIFPILEKRFGVLDVFYSQSLILIPAVILLPYIHYLYNIKWLLWVLVCAFMFVIQECATMAWKCQVIFINNSVTFDKLGSVNGVGSSINSFLRAVAPLAFGGIFSFSLSATAITIGYPFDYRLVFLVFGTVFMLCVFFVACLPSSINKQKIIEDT